MKYCINFSRTFRHFDILDEVILNNITDLNKLINFLDEGLINKSTRIILNIAGSALSSNAIEGAPAILNMIQNQGWNITVIINKENKDIFVTSHIPFFYSNFPKNIEEVYVQAYDGVSDVYITEELGFRLKDLQNIKEIFKVQYRVIPNIVQSANNKIFEAMPSFWIRPEDTELYEPFVDIFELWGGKNESRISVIYEIYKQKQWLGDLNDIILDFHFKSRVPNTGMNPHFAEMRLNCGRKCLIGKPCNICYQMADLAEQFNKVGLEVIKKREKPIRTEEDIDKALQILENHKDELRVDEATNDI
jgi:hypothetical protein